MAQGIKEVRTLVNRRGKELETTRTDKEAFDELERLVEEGKADQFATDLIQKGIKNGLSEEQFWWVHKLCDQTNVKLPLGNISGRMAAAVRAGVSLRAMKCSLETSENKIVRLSIAGQRSKNAGDVWVSDDGKYPDNVLYGRIETATGIFHGRNTPEDVLEMLTLVNDHPDAYLPW